MNTLQDTRQYYLNSIGGSLKNGYLKSDIEFTTPNIIKDDKNILYNKVSIVKAQIPYSFYIINEYNNLLALSTGNIYITYGNYNAQSFINYLNSKMPLNMTISLNSTNGVFTINYNQSFQILPTSTIYKILGIEQKTYTSVSNSITCPYPCNFLGSKNLYIKSNLNLDNLNTATNDYITLCSIPISVEPYSIILYNNYSNSKHLIKNKNLDNIELKIYDDMNNLIDFNNIDWTLTLEIETTTQFFYNNIDLNQALNIK